MYLRPILIAYAVASLGLFSGSGQAEADHVEELPKHVEFKGIDKELLENVHANVRLIKALKEHPDLGHLKYLQLKNAALEQIQEALQPFGYYRSTVSYSTSEDKLVFDINLGQPVVVRKLEIAVEGPAQELKEYQNWLESIKLKEGQPLNQNDYEDAKKSLQSINLSLGFFDASLERHEILIDEERLNADVFLIGKSGKRYKFGEISTQWANDQEKIRAAILAPHITVYEGAEYDASLLAETQSGLLKTPYFASVDVRPELSVLQGGEVPIDVGLTPQKPHAFSFTVGAGTDTGVRATVGYENRMLNKNGHSLNARIGGSQVRKTAILNYKIPLTRAVRDSIDFSAAWEDEDNDFRRYKSRSVGVELTREWNSAVLNFGLLASREDFFVGSTEQSSTLLIPSIRWHQVVREEGNFPRRGWSAEATLKGASESLGSDIDLLQFILDTKVILPFYKGRLLARFSGAASDIDDPLELPSSLGFLTGGDTSVRGYRYESIGVPLLSQDELRVEDGDSDIVVGQHLLVASLEYEHPLNDQYSVAGFFDIGDAFNDDLDLNRGVGVGVRWRLPFGALKLDLASALDKEGDPLRLHFSFGSSF